MPCGSPSAPCGEIKGRVSLRSRCVRFRTTCWIASLSLAMQFACCLLSGAIRDKFGRRSAMRAFGILSRTVPCALWAIAGDFRHFARAAAFNGMWRVTANGFGCMLVEDGDPGKLIHIHTILNVIGLFAGFLAPLAGPLIGRFSLIAAMRAIYAFSAALMAARFAIQHRLSRESCAGASRMAECLGRSR